MHTNPSHNRSLRYSIGLAFGLTVFILLSSCSVTQAVKLKDCQYQYTKVTDITFMGMTKREIVSPMGIVQVTKALRGKTDQVPLGFTVHLKVTNPNDGIAAMDRLYYTISLDSVQIADGNSASDFVVAGHGSADLPLVINVDLKQLLSSDAKPTVQKLVKQFLGMQSEPTKVTILLRPIIRVAGVAMGVPKAIPLVFMYGGNDTDPTTATQAK